MPGRRHLKGVLQAFLGAFCSRNSDLGGYWLFGQVPLEHRQFSLTENSSDPLESRAVTLFLEQLDKHGLPLSYIAQARISSEKTAPHTYELTALVQSDLGRTYTRSQRIQVRPHDPNRERRRNI